MGKDKDDKGKGDKQAEGPLKIVDKGSFTAARCECGWRGPARRSRKRAREDAAAHLDARCKAFRKK